jgi:hypothetical protein
MKNGLILINLVALSSGLLASNGYAFGFGGHQRECQRWDLA